MLCFLTPCHPQVLPLAYEMASAMDYMHSQGLIHGDFKAANVLMKDLANSSNTHVQRKFTSKVGHAASDFTNLS